MKYAELRECIKSGDMLLWEGHATGDLRHDTEVELVEHATASNWTHVGVAWAEHGRVWVMDLATTGCAPRILSEDVPQGWIPAPRRLSDQAMAFAFSRFGKMTYSRWQAILGWAKRLVIGDDLAGQCAEYALEIYRVDGIAPSDVATPAACARGALARWPGASLYTVES